MSKEPSDAFEELVDSVNIALDELNFLELLVLRYYVLDKLELSEISRALNTPVRGVKRILNQSLNKIRNFLAKKFSEEDIKSILRSL